MHGKAVWMNKLYTTWRTINFNITNNVRRLQPEQCADVYKVRIARPGEGKSGGHRVIVYFRNEYRTFFSYGFSKNDKGNISRKELKRFKEDAKDRLSFTDEQIEAYLRRSSMKYKSDIYESDIAEMVHENAMLDFKLGFISEAEMREYDELCLPEEALQGKTAHGATVTETVNIEHADLVTASV